MRLTDSEWKIINCLWKKPMTLMELTRALYAKTGWSKQTIITFLIVWLKKGLFPMCKRDGPSGSVLR